MERLVAAGAEYDRPDSEGPVQVAGWEGLPDLWHFFCGKAPI